MKMKMTIIIIITNERILLGQPPHLDGSTIKELGTGKGRIEEGFARARRTLRHVSLQPNAQTESATTGMCTCDAREVRV